MKLSIGFIGLGTMGRPMARHLLRHGFRMKLYARRAEVFESEARSLVEQGATPCLALSQVANDVDVVITNVTATDDVEHVLLGEPDGAAHHARPGTLFIDHSTIDPMRTMQIASRIKALGMDFVDAPVSGGVWASEEARLIVMQGGSRDACARADDVIRTYARSITRVGDCGHGQIAKLSNQIAQTITIEGVAECLAFAETLGADPQSVFEAIKDGFAGSQMMSLMAPKMIARDFTAGIEARLHAKDVSIALQTARGCELALPCLEAVGSRYDAVMRNDQGNRDSSILFDLLMQRREIE